MQLPNRFLKFVYNNILLFYQVFNECQTFFIYEDRKHLDMATIRYQGQTEYLF